MKRGRLVRQPVEHRCDLVPSLPGESEQSLARLRVELAIIVGGQVDLGAIARREDHGLPVTRERACKLCGAVQLDRHPLAQFDRRPMMRDPDQRQLHATHSPPALMRRNA